MARYTRSVGSGQFPPISKMLRASLTYIFTPAPPRNPTVIAHQPASAKVSTDLAEIRRPRIGLALSGGGARGSAHMGVLRTLEQAGIGYDMMSATSIGALAGLIHCCGYSADYMIEACKRELMPSWWLSRIPGGVYLHLTRLIRPGGIAKGICRYIGQDCRLEELPTPLYITATDLISGELVVQDRGCAVTALMASMSLPGMTSPVANSNRLLVDGGVLNNLPGEVLRQRGADIVSRTSTIEAVPCRSSLPGTN